MPHHEVTTFHVTKFLAFTDKKLIVHTRMYVFHGEMYNNQLLWLLAPILFQDCQVNVLLIKVKYDFYDLRIHEAHCSVYTYMCLVNNNLSFMSELNEAQEPFNGSCSANHK